jgi:release factor glutamine methyltransferase
MSSNASPATPSEAAEAVAPVGVDLAAWVRAAGARLAAAGVPSPSVDAELLAAHVLGLGRGELVAALRRGAVLSVDQVVAVDRLLARRCGREPLQHLTGRAPFRRIELLVGPGVFVPRPETEVLVEAAVAELLDSHDGPALVVDLCTGSGAIALAVADEVPQAQVVALERESAALAWARRNVAVQAAGGGVELRAGDVTEAIAPGGVLADLVGRVDVVVANPPYIPDGAVPREVEVARHDPAAALFGGGDDGLDVPRAVVVTAAALLRPGGLLLMEHGEPQGAQTRALLGDGDADSDDGGWHEVSTLVDLTGRDRVLRARRRG